jgi:hypothetical protein
MRCYWLVESESDAVNPQFALAVIGKYELAPDRSARPKRWHYGTSALLSINRPFLNRGIA